MSPGHRFYEGNLAGGLGARAWVGDYAKAFVAGDLDRTAALDAQIQKSVPYLRGLLEEHRGRLRARLLYRLLRRYDPLYLDGPPEAYGTDSDALDKWCLRRRRRPGCWGLRALHEISLRAPGAFDGPRDEVCASPHVKAAPEYSGSARLLGAPPP